MISRTTSGEVAEDMIVEEVAELQHFESFTIE
jgi:hypothetical protein